jgi:drug/metabolite transporter (DMT)-like permease
MTPRRATIELLFAGALWGFGFINQRYSFETWGPLAAGAVRFEFAFLIGLIIIFCSPSLRRHPHLEQIRLSFIPGFFLGLSLLLQNMGIQKTTIANSGFITTLYALWVPLLEAAIFRKKIPGLQWLMVFLAMIGTALLCQLTQLQFNIGDFFIFLCSISSSVQILAIHRLQNRIRSPLIFNIYQIGWMGVFATCAALIFRQPLFAVHVTLKAGLGILYLAVFASIMAFQIQIRTQRVLNSVTASILFLLEAPFAAFFGWSVLHESLTPPQIFGAALIFFAAVYSARIEASLQAPASHQA